MTSRLNISNSVAGDALNSAPDSALGSASNSAPGSALNNASKNTEPYRRLRFLTAASLFDGHDAAINIMRRILQASGAEVIHLAHNRSVQEIADAAVQEDVDAIAISSYQGGHIEYFKYLVDCLRELRAEHIKVFGGGGGVIIPAEIKELHDYGVTRIYSPADGQAMGLQGMIDDMLARSRGDGETHGGDAQRGEGGQRGMGILLGKGKQRAGNAQRPAPPTVAELGDGSDESSGRLLLARAITAITNNDYDATELQNLCFLAADKTTPVLGITGTGGAGKSSSTDEIVRRFRQDSADELSIAILAIDPTRKKTGGALLGDRIRMNAINHRNIYMRSLATRDADTELPARLTEIIAALKLSGFDLIIIETPGIGQGDAGIVPYVDVSLYVMTPEFGAASQLEKIDMLDFADIFAINKFDRKGSEDALRDVAKQVQRNRQAFSSAPEEMPVFGTIASRFNDDGITALYQALLPLLQGKGLKQFTSRLPPVAGKVSSERTLIIPPQRQRYLAEIAEEVRDYHRQVDEQTTLARQCQQLRAARTMLKARNEDNATSGQDAEGITSGSALQTENSTAASPANNYDVDGVANKSISAELDALITHKANAMDNRARRLLETWPEVKAAYAGDEYVVKVRERAIKTPLTRSTLSGTKIPRVALPRYEDHGDLLKWLLLENIPGRFPFTGGAFQFKRESEDPTRMFAGEGDAFRTNRRFKALSKHAAAKRLSTAFDSVTLYGFDPSPRPDIYGKVGNSGVSIATLDDMKALYDGFDLCSPGTSVSMTINGPAPTILAMYLNAAIDQQAEKFIAQRQRQPNDDEYRNIKAEALRNVRGTVQADILKEDQGQNTCIFSTEFSLKLMGDIQEYFTTNQVRNFYSVSISGYHIAEAGANPISQLAFTLANGFTFVEAYLARGMQVDDFAHNLSFFFSNGMDPEYTVLGRVARRLWAVAMRFRYGANERSQKLKYHIQTSGRSLHAQEMAFNDIRTTLQALIAIYDNCNSLHTNAYDEAITTPTGESVRRAMAIQLIINREWGLAVNENSSQGAFIIEELTDLVEEAVLQEFERLSDRGGVLGAMETGYQRGKIQDESLYYEHRKHDGSLPIIGVNTFLADAESGAGDGAGDAAGSARDGAGNSAGGGARSSAGEPHQEIQLARSTEEEKQSQLHRLADFHKRHADASEAALQRLQVAATNNENVFAELMHAVRHCSLGQITDAFFEVGGQYRRTM